MGLQESHTLAAPQVNPFGIRSGTPAQRTIAGLKLLRTRGVLNEASDQPAVASLGTDPAIQFIPPEVLALIPGSGRENTIIPLKYDGETITVAAADANDIALADKLRFILAKDIKFVLAPRPVILEAINRYYAAETESVDSMLQEFTDTAIDFRQKGTTLDLAASISPPPSRSPAGRFRGKGIVSSRRDARD